MIKICRIVAAGEFLPSPNRRDVMFYFSHFMDMFTSNLLLDSIFCYVKMYVYVSPLRCLVAKMFLAIFQVDGWKLISTSEIIFLLLILFCIRLVLCDSGAGTAHTSTFIFFATQRDIIKAIPNEMKISTRCIQCNQCKKSINEFLF